MSISISGNGTFTGVSTNYSFDKNVSIGGTLTYEDVTNVDSIGIVTARGGLHVVGAASSVGIGSDDPAHLLDLSNSSNAYLRQVRGNSTLRVGPAGDQASDGAVLGTDTDGPLRFFTNGSSNERMRIDNSVNGANVTLKHNTTSGLIGLGDTLGRINFTDSNGGEFASIRGENDGTESNLDYPGRITFWTTPDNASNSIERLRISETGSVSVGSTLGRNGPGTLICHSATDQGFRLSRNSGRNYLEFVVETAGTSTENHFSIDVPNANIIIYIMMDYIGSRQTSSDAGVSRIGFENYVIARRIDQDVTFGSNYNSLNFEVNGPDAGGANDKQAVNPFMQRTGSEASTATQQVEVQVQPRCSNGSNGWVTSHVRMIINGTLDYNDFRVIVD